MSRTKAAPQSQCIALADNSTVRIDARNFVTGPTPKDIHALAARLGEQLIQQNRGLLQDFGVDSSLHFDGSRVDIVLTSSNQVGAIPLVSPTTGKVDYGLVVVPRFGWDGIGPVMARTGMRVTPSLLPLPLLPRSARSIPPWVLSTVILSRIQALLAQLDRRFEMVEAATQTPKGTVNWGSYLSDRMSRADFLHVPCRFPDLLDNLELKSAIRYTLQKQKAGLESQARHSEIVATLLDFCHHLLEQVRGVPVQEPSPRRLQFWNRTVVRGDAFRKGLQAIEWTVEDRGLAGQSELQGIPWRMSMDSFFEAYVEMLVERLSHGIGGILRVGRKRETLTPLNWDPPFAGSQKYLLPDVVLEREGETLLIDAKYKRHWEEMRTGSWSSLEEEIREHHRQDLLQVLAYSTTIPTNKVTLMLLYPCKKGTWQSMQARHRTRYKGSLTAGERLITVYLSAVPFDAPVSEVVDHLVGTVQRARAA